MLGAVGLFLWLLVSVIAGLLLGIDIDLFRLP